MFASVDPVAARALLAKGVEIVDVREADEFAQGHIPGARLLPLSTLRNNPRAVLPKGNVIFVCAAGVRSATAARMAASYGATKVYNLEGGTRAWVKAGFAIASLDVAV